MTTNPLAFVTSEDLVAELRRRHPAHAMVFVVAGDRGQEMIRTFCAQNLIVGAGLVSYLDTITKAAVMATAKTTAHDDTRFDGIAPTNLPPIPQ